MVSEVEQEPIILPAEVEHLEEIAALAGDIWRKYFPGIISLEQIEYMLSQGYTLEVLSHEILAQGISYDCMVLGSELIGFASYGSTQSLGEMKLHKLYLAPEFHGKGYGSKFLQHVEATAKSRDYKTLVLTVNKNNDRAISSYKRDGFVVRDSVVVDIGSGFVMDDYVMVKDLDG
jgi:ribosomal protein S18 acetylase RimI-like enzyme